MTRTAGLTLAAVSIFAGQTVSSHLLRRAPFLPSPPPLSNLPLELGGWSQTREEVVDRAALDMLGPDDFLARLYHARRGPEQAELFVAYYKTQLRAKNAHDPKVCLPGAGWSPTASHLTYVSAGPGSTFPANYYRIKRGPSEQVVLYWFQTLKGVYTFEQQLQAHRVWDAVFDNRTDMALVRVTVPVGAQGVSAADASATQLAEIVYRQMLSYFPPTGKARS